MVEFHRYSLEDPDRQHVETIVVENVGTDRFFLNEELAILVALNAKDSGGQIQFMGDTTHIEDLATCYKDPSSGDLVKIDDLDPQTPVNFKGSEIIRLRYKYDGELEEAHFVHKKNQPKRISNQTVTTPRMRRIMQSGLSFE